ncbi:MAG TPA: hypothetical protein VNC60_04265, partial [Actinomycetota bacterium]|nr:hypothetical protein [Actinomycetota bacterium]
MAKILQGERVATCSRSEIDDGPSGLAHSVPFPPRPGPRRGEESRWLYVGWPNRTVIAFQQQQFACSSLVVIEQGSAESVLGCWDNRH